MFTVWKTRVVLITIILDTLRLLSDLLRYFPMTPLFTDIFFMVLFGHNLMKMLKVTQNCKKYSIKATLDNFLP